MEVALGEDGEGELGIGVVAELGTPYFAGVFGHDDGNGRPLSFEGGELFEEQPGVYRAAGAGDGNDNFVHVGSVICRLTKVL